jgi:hypothetical protein
MLKHLQQLKWSALLVAVVYANYVAYDKFLRPEPGPYYKNQQKQRGPASLAKNKLPALDVMTDFFQHDTYNGYVNYDMDVHFWTDKGKKYFKRNGKKALEDGLKKTFFEVVNNNAKGDKKLPAEAPKHIMKEFMKRFVYTIKAIKLVDANFEVDFSFAPRNIKVTDYKEELASNQLVHLETKGELLKSLNKVDQTLPEKVLEAKIPSTGHLFQYVGGAITISAEVLDTNWKITQPIPKTKQNAVKGQVRFRKYYRVNNVSDLNVTSLLESSNLKGKTTHFKKRKGHDEAYITVDVIYKYNLANPIPQKDKVVIHMGEIVSLDKSHDNLIKRIFTVFKKSNDVRTADFYVEGDYSGRGPTSRFKTKIKKLVYDFQDKKFLTKSSFSTHSDNSSSNGIISSKVKKVLLKEKEDEFIKALKLEQLIESKKI